MRKLKAVAVTAVVAALLSGCAVMTPAFQALERDIGTLFRAIGKVIESTPAEKRPGMEMRFRMPESQPATPEEPKTEAPAAQEPIVVTSIAPMPMPETTPAKVVQEVTAAPTPVSCVIRGTEFLAVNCSLLQRLDAGEKLPFGPDRVARVEIDFYCDKIRDGFVDVTVVVPESRELYFTMLRSKKGVTGEGDLYSCFKKIASNGQKQVKNEEPKEKGNWFLRKPPPGTAGTGFTTIRRPSVSSGRR